MFASASVGRFALTGKRSGDHFANSIASSAKPFISSALPLGSRKNMVACSPGWPSNADGRFDHELRARRRQPVGERLPVLHRQHDAEMGHGDIVAVHRVRPVTRITTCMGDDLIASLLSKTPLRPLCDQFLS